jgi:hypothetical protein
MASATNDVQAYQVRRIEKEAIYLVSSVCAVLEAISEGDVEKAATVQEVIEAIDEVHEVYDDLCRVTANWEDDNWNQAASASGAKRFKFRRRSKMTALEASFSAGRLIVDDCATYLPRREKSSRDDLGKFAANVGKVLKDGTLQAIEEQLRKERRVVSGLQLNYAEEWEGLDKNPRNVVRAMMRLHRRLPHPRLKGYSMRQIKAEAAKGGEDAPTFVGSSTLTKLSRRLQWSGFAVKEEKRFWVPQPAREWLLELEPEAADEIFVTMKRT